jgi:hypothetical protein
VIAFGVGSCGACMFGSAIQIRFDMSSIRIVLARPGVLEDLAAVDDSPASTVDAWVSLIPHLMWISGADVSHFAGAGPLITDDRPLTEYFLLRRLIGSKSPPMTEENLRAALNPTGVVIGARDAKDAEISKD